MSGKLEDLTVRKGAWSNEEDVLLKRCIARYGEGKWRHVPTRAGLRRCRKSCRLRWLNYLRPDIKRGDFAEDEIDIIIRLHKLLGNRWSLIAGRIPGRTANDIKNHWNAHLRKKPAIKWKVMKEKKNNTSAAAAPITAATNNKRKNREKVVETCSGEVIKPQPRTLISNLRWFGKFSLGNGPKADGNQGGDLPQSPILMMDQQITPTWHDNNNNCGNLSSSTGSGSGVNNIEEKEDELFDDFWEKLFEGVNI